MFHPRRCRYGHQLRVMFGVTGLMFGAIGYMFGVLDSWKPVAAPSRLPFLH